MIFLTLPSDASQWAVPAGQQRRLPAEAPMQSEEAEPPEAEDTSFLPYHPSNKRGGSRMLQKISTRALSHLNHLNLLKHLSRH